MHDDESIHLRSAQVADAAALAAFSARIFEETFGPDNSPEDMANYLVDAFSPEKQAVEISNKSGRVILALRQEQNGGQIGGYAQILFEDEGPSVQLKRLYVDAALHGSGLARRLMDAAIMLCREHETSRLWLSVWDQNPRAIAFYKKTGFIVSGVTTFELGADIQTDLVMEMDLTKKQPLHPGV